MIGTPMKLEAVGLTVISFSYEIQTMIYAGKKLETNLIIFSQNV